MLLKLLIFISMCSSQAFAQGSLSYSGRLVHADGSPVSGPVNLEFHLAYSSDMSVQLCTLPKSSVSLAQGVFHTKLDFSPATCVGGKSLLQVLTEKPGADSLLIRVRDVSNSKVYGYQALSAMPFAVVAEQAKSIGDLGASANQVLTWNGSEWVPQNTQAVSSSPIGAAGGDLSGSYPNPVIAAGAVDYAKTNFADGVIPQAKIQNLSLSLAAKENALGASVSANYLDGARAWRNFEASVRDAFLTGFSSGPALPVVAGDSVLSALGKLDASIASVQAGSNEYLQRNGSVALTGNLSAGNYKLTNLGTPTAANDAATMSYVDGKATQWTKVGSDLFYTPGGVGVGVGVLTSSAIFEVSSTNKGILIPRLSELERDAIVAPASGLLVYNTTSNAFNFYSGTQWSAFGVAGAGAPPTGTAGGDLIGNYPAPTIAAGAVSYAKTNFVDGDIPQSKVNGLVTGLASKLDDSQLDASVALGTDNTKIPSQGAVKSYVDTAIGTGVLGGDLSGSVSNSSVIRLQNRNLAATAPLTNEVLKWNGSAWAPAPDVDTNTTYTAGAGLSLAGTVFSLPSIGTAGTYGSGTQIPVLTTDAYGRVTGVTITPITGATPTGAAGGDLSGSYPNPVIANSAVTDAKIASVSGSKVTGNIPGNAAGFTGALAGDVTGTQAATSVVRIRGTGVVATAPLPGEVLKFNGTNWAPALDTTTPTGSAGGDLTGSYPNPTIAPAAVTDDKIDSVSGTKVTGNIPGNAAGFTSVLAGDVTGTQGATYVERIRGTGVSAAAPALNQVLKFNGTVWAPAADVDTNTTYSAGAGLTLAGTVFSLPSVGTAGTYGSATQVPSITTDAQGRVSGVALTTISGVVPGGTAAGDLSGTYPNPTVARLQGRAVASTLPTSGQVLKFDGTVWAPAADVDTNTTYTAGTGLSLAGTVFSLPSVGTAGTYGSATQVPSITTDAQGRVSSVALTTISGVAPGGAAAGDLSGTYPNPTVARLQGRSVASTLPTTGQVLKWNGTAWAPAADADTIYTLPNVGTAGTYTKVTTDAQGRVTAGTTLAATDIPVLDTSKITTGIFTTARLPATTSYLGSTIESAEIADGTVATADLANQSVTNTKLQGVATNCAAGTVLVADGAGGFSCSDISSGRITYSNALTTNSTISIPESVIIQYCADDDGCELRMGMFNWDGTGRTASRHAMFFYNATNKNWRASNDGAATNGDGTASHPFTAWSCYFTDGTYLNGTNTGDGDLNFGLLNWTEYSGETCKLTIID